MFSLSLRAEKTWYTLTDEHGLKGMDVMQMMQLEDGRMVFVSSGYVNLYDGTSFRSIRRDPAFESSISGYRGHTHLYVDDSRRCWIKNLGTVSCLDLRTLRFIPRCDSLLALSAVQDFFVDSDKDLWCVSRDTIINRRTDRVFILPSGVGEVQDVDVMDKRVCVFTNRGEAVVFESESGRLISVCQAYGEDLCARCALTSLTVRSADGIFYQLRTGNGGSVFLSFDPRQLSWHILLEGTELYHTLVVTPSRVAYISTSRGYLVYNLSTGQCTRLESLRLPDGTQFAAGFNTVCLDREGGIWLGSYNQGVLYSSPLSGIFDTYERDIALTPVLLSVSLHGRRADADNGLLPLDAPFVEHLELEHTDNAPSFLFSPVKYVHPRRVFYRYRMGRGIWCEATADSHPELVDDRGRLRLSYVNLPPGLYELEVMVSSDEGRWNGGVRRITFVIHAPWWASTVAYIGYGMMLLVMIVLMVWLYARRLRRRAERRNREDRLLLRIQNLIEKCNQYENAVNVVLTEREEPVEKPVMSAAELDFLNRATALVERNLSNSAYSVEQLSRDICMERSGLYKKLTSILDKSPVAFIRMIRLRRAVQLLEQGDKTIAEVAEATGFSSPGYFSKCFQREYGCKPSEYTKTAE